MSTQPMPVLRPGTEPLAPGAMRAAMCTDPGVVRVRNEDCAHADPAMGLFVVADGVGGHAAGEVASAVAVEVVRRVVADDAAYLAWLATANERERQTGVVEVLASAVRAANNAVRRVASCDPDKHGMMTTLDALLVVGRDAFLAHVGDSRTYLVRGGDAAQLTRDHTVAELLLATGTLTDGPAIDAHKAALANAIGLASHIPIDLSAVTLAPGDQLLLCTDGLYRYFAPVEIAMRVSWGDPQRGLRELVELARQRGGHDNITGVLVDLD